MSLALTLRLQTTRWLGPLLLWLLTLAGLPGRADEADFDLAETAGTLRIWRVADGLPADNVAAILQARDGYLWVGTSAGLARFDGVRFSWLPLDGAGGGNSSGVTALSEDTDGSLWIGTQQEGLYELTDGSLRHFGPAEGLLDPDVTSLQAGKSGQVWIGTRSGLNLWTGRGLQAFTVRDGLPDKFVAGVNVARSGTVWITTRAGMCVFAKGRIAPYALQTESQGRSPEYLGAYEDRRGNLWAFGDTYLINLAEGKRFNYFRSSESASVRIWSLCEGRDGRLWIGTSGRGLFCFEDNHFQPVVLGGSRWSYDVRAICEDRAGDLWLGTSGGGLAQLRPQSLNVVRVGQGLPPGPPTALGLDPAGRIFAAVQRDGVFAGDAGHFDRLAGGTGLAVRNFVTALALAPDGTLWAGTLGEGLYGVSGEREVHLTTADGLPDDSITAAAVDGQGALWVATRAGPVAWRVGARMTLQDPGQAGAAGAVTALARSAAGGLWAGTLDGRVFGETNGIFATKPVLVDPEHHPVLALLEDGAGRLWAGLAGGGLTCRFHGGCFLWSGSNGLPGAVVSGVAEDGGGNLWLMTEAGIHRVDAADVERALQGGGQPLACRRVSEMKTLPPAGAVYGAGRAVLAPDGELWLGTSDGVFRVDTRMAGPAPPVPPVYLESVAINGQAPVSLPPGGPFRTPFRTPVDVRSLEFRFTALDFTEPQEVRFQHKLEGLDTEWVADGAVRSVRYGPLSHGRYRFRVEARTAGGAWHEAPQPFVLVVPTPLLLQPWALMLYLAAAVGVVAGVVRLVSHRRLRRVLARLEQQQSLERERMRIARDMHDELGSKLTKISFLSEHAQVDPRVSGPLAGQMQDIAQTSRELLQTMDEIVWVVNPRNDTLENLVSYLSHYAMEYFQNTPLECDLRLPPEIPAHPFSSEVRHNVFLSFEEALNNVLKHSGARRVAVELVVEAGALVIRIADDGKGLAAAGAAGPPAGKRGGNGLRNLRQRMADIGGACTVTSPPGGGAVVVLRVPLAKPPGA